MAFEPKEYAQHVPPSDKYPSGSFKNESFQGAADGTPLDNKAFDDVLGLLQSWLVNANITPSNTPDTAISSQYLEACLKLYSNSLIRTTTVNTTLVITDRILYVDATSGDITVSTGDLSALVSESSTAEITIRRTDSSPNSVVIDSIGGGLVELSPKGKTSVVISSDGNTIYKVGEIITPSSSESIITGSDMDSYITPASLKDSRLEIFSATAGQIRMAGGIILKYDNYLPATGGVITNPWVFGSFPNKVITAHISRNSRISRLGYHSWATMISFDPSMYSYLAINTSGSDKVVVWGLGY